MMNKTAGEIKIDKKVKHYIVVFGLALANGGGSTESVLRGQVKKAASTAKIYAKIKP